MVCRSAFVLYSRQSLNPNLRIWGKISSTRPPRGSDMMEEKMANPSWAQVIGHSSAEHVVHQFTAFTSVCRSITLHGICARTRRHRRHSAL